MGNAIPQVLENHELKMTAEELQEKSWIVAKVGHYICIYHYVKSADLSVLVKAVLDTGDKKPSFEMDEFEGLLPKTGIIH